MDAVNPRAPALAARPESEMVTLAELARQWRMDRKTVRRLLEAAGVPCYVFCARRNGSIRYSRSEVESYLRMCKGRTKPTA